MEAAKYCAQRHMKAVHRLLRTGRLTRRRVSLILTEHREYGSVVFIGMYCTIPYAPR